MDTGGLGDAGSFQLQHLGPESIELLDELGRQRTIWFVHLCWPKGTDDFIADSLQSCECGDGPQCSEANVHIEERGGVISFVVRVTPRASRNAIEGEMQGALKVRVTAPPIDDRANEAVRRLLAESLMAPLSAVRIIAGAKGRMKRVEVAGVNKERIEALVRGAKSHK